MTLGFKNGFGSCKQTENYPLKLRISDQTYCCYRHPTPPKLSCKESEIKGQQC